MRYKELELLYRPMEKAITAAVAAGFGRGLATRVITKSELPVRSFPDLLTNNKK